MTTDIDPRVVELMALVKRLLDKEDADPLSAYWAIESKITALIAKVPCIASDPRCPCNDGDTCNYVATKKTPAFEVPHPDATQLSSIADLLPTLSGADPAMLANVGHYLRGLSDRVKVLPVARTGPLRVAAEVSAPVEVVPLGGTQESAKGVAKQFAPIQVARWFLHEKHWRQHAEAQLKNCEARIANQRKEIERLQNTATAAAIMTPVATTPPQAEPSKEPFASNGKRLEKAMDMIVGYASASVSEALAHRSGARLSDYSLSCYPSIKEYLASHFMQADAEIAHLTEELADEKAVVDCLKSELADRLQKQRAAEAELREVRKDAVRLDWLLPNLHPATWGMEFPGGYEWDSPAELLAKWRAAIDAELAAAPEAPKP